MHADIQANKKTEQHVICIPFGRCISLSTSYFD